MPGAPAAAVELGADGPPATAQGPPSGGGGAGPPGGHHPWGSQVSAAGIRGLIWRWGHLGWSTSHRAIQGALQPVASFPRADRNRKQPGPVLL